VSKTHIYVVCTVRFGFLHSALEHGRGTFQPLSLPPSCKSKEFEERTSEDISLKEIWERLNKEATDLVEQSVC
jgi:hypothetical protein